MPALCLCKQAAAKATNNVGRGFRNQFKGRKLCPYLNSSVIVPTATQVSDHGILKSDAIIQ